MTGLDRQVNDYKRRADVREAISYGDVVWLLNELIYERDQLALALPPVSAQMENTCESASIGGDTLVGATGSANGVRAARNLTVGEPPVSAQEPLHELLADLQEALAARPSHGFTGICINCGTDFANEARLNRAMLSGITTRLRKALAPGPPLRGIEGPQGHEQQEDSARVDRQPGLTASVPQPPDGDK